MAKPSWLTIDPSSGSGNGTVNNGATPHTGRVKRSYTATVKASGGPSKTYSIYQTPKAAFVSFDNEEQAIDKNGTMVTLTGKSNCAGLQVSGTFEDRLLASGAFTLKINGSEQENGTEIDGDPGATAEYTFSIELKVEANETVEEKVGQIKVQDSSSSSIFDTINLRQASGDETLSISPDAITIPQSGEAQSVTITSNTTWTVS